jgi:hypothetical protein
MVERAMKTLHQLGRLKERWLKAVVKDSARRDKALKRIDQAISHRQSSAVRCALPKKKQRQLGLLPALSLGDSVATSK